MNKESQVCKLVQLHNKSITLKDTVELIDKPEMYCSLSSTQVSAFRTEYNCSHAIGRESKSNGDVCAI